MNEHDSEIVLNRLLSGETPEAVAHSFPLERGEVLSSARIVQNLMSLKSARPREEGLRRALSSVRAGEARTAATLSPFTYTQFIRTSFIYKGAFVIPLLFLVLIASGAYFLPWGAPDVDPSSDVSIESVASDAGGTSLSMESGALMKSAGVQTMSLSQSVPPALPSDQDLASVFGPEITLTTDATEADSAEADIIADDTSGTESYNTIYDAHAF